MYRGLRHRILPREIRILAQAVFHRKQLGHLKYTYRSRRTSVHTLFIRYLHCRLSWPSNCALIFHAPPPPVVVIADAADPTEVKVLRGHGTKS